MPKLKYFLRKPPVKKTREEIFKKHFDSLCEFNRNAYWSPHSDGKWADPDTDLGFSMISFRAEYETDREVANQDLLRVDSIAVNDSNDLDDISSSIEDFVRWI